MFPPIALLFIFIYFSELNGVPINNEMPSTQINDKERTLYIRSVPGYPGVRSDLYEVYMEPYYFVSKIRLINTHK